MVTLRSHTTRQPDHTHYRRWEIAGAAHAESPQWIPGITPAPDMAPGMRCAAPINTAPHHAVVKAALHALTRWVGDGVAPRSSAPIELGDPTAPDPITTTPSMRSFALVTGSPEGDLARAAAAASPVGK